MMKWIRWQGLVVFVIVAGALAAFWLLLFDGLIKRAIEKTGGLIVGAQVDVNHLDVALFPLGITIEGLQVTNPEAPETNSFECGRIAFNLDSLNLLRRKTIINEMAVLNVRFDTPRKRAGWVRAPEDKKTEGAKAPLFGLPLEIPNVKQILKNENLESVKLIESAREDLQKRRTDWKQRIGDMPDGKTIDEYKARIEDIRKKQKNVLGLTEQVAAARAVRRDIEKDLDRVKQVRAAFSNDLAAAKNFVERAEQAPLNDVRRLRDKYSISPAGLANMTQLLFGNEISTWIRTGLLWYNRIQPVVERAKARKKDATAVKPVRGKGVDLRFKEYRPLPDFLIDRTAVSAVTAAGELAGTIRNITPDQNILGIPLTFSLSGEKLRAARSIALTGELNHIIPEKSRDVARFAMRGFKLRNMILSKDKDLPISLQDAVVDFGIDGSFTQSLKATLTANVSSARMNVGGEGSSNRFVTAVRSALSKVSSFSLNADITGTLDNYKMDITSDLDRVLKTAVSSVVREESAKLEQQLKAEIQERTGAQLKELRETFNGLNADGNKLESVQKQLNSVLEEAIKSATGGKKLRLPR